MNNLIIVLVSLFSLICISQVEASPATQLQLSYNVKTIHIEAKHPSNRLDHHYIRSVLVVKNSKDKQYFYFPRQTSANQFIANLDFIAIPGDSLDILLTCSQGGVVRGKLVIPLEKKDSK